MLYLLYSIPCASIQCDSPCCFFFFNFFSIIISVQKIGIVEEKKIYIIAILSKFLSKICAICTNKWSSSSSSCSEGGRNSSSSSRCKHIKRYTTAMSMAVAEDEDSYCKGSDDNEVPEENYSLPYQNSNGSSNGEAVILKLDVPVPLREEPKFPKEKWKTFIAFVILLVNFILATVSLSLVHERLPDRNIYGPLPDVFLDNIGAQDWALYVSEILIMVTVNTCILLTLLHKHRFIVMRRIFLILAVLYFMRSITMYVTVLPVSSTTYYCSAKSNTTATPMVIIGRVFQLMSGFGLSINGKHTYCGDYIYSGHTVMLVLGYLIITEYSPRRFFILHWVAWVSAFIGVIFVLLAHGHYTIDILIAYYVTTRLWWTYHTLANNHFLLKPGANNYIGREWWYTYFKYFEKNVRGPVPRQYEWPLPWPRNFHSKLPNRES